LKAGVVINISHFSGLWNFQFKSMMDSN
jgi:hypothetical protein